MKEIWKDIKGFEGQYQVSNLGRIKSIKKGKILIPSYSKKGYARIDLPNRKSVEIHRIVAKHFIKNTENKPEVNHVNGIKTDNRIENLEWVTRQENMDHAYKIGLIKPLKLTFKKVLEIRKKIGKESIYKIAREYGVSDSMIALIRDRKRWKNI